ncbi:MAG: YlbF family regulator [Archaeoglobales archaeon]|nr:MAG: YlbF family regulator [Archaeoglobales archaeon]
MVPDFVKEKALALAVAIQETDEYKDFLEKEDGLKKDKTAQELLSKFQEKQREFISKQLNGEVDQELLGELTEIQAQLNRRESVVDFLDSYNRLINLLNEIGEIISKQIEFDFGEAYRS